MVANTPTVVHDAYNVERNIANGTVHIKNNKVK